MKVRVHVTSRGEPVTGALVNALPQSGEGARAGWGARASRRPTTTASSRSRCLQERWYSRSSAGAARRPGSSSRPRSRAPRRMTSRSRSRRDDLGARARPERLAGRGAAGVHRVGPRRGGHIVGILRPGGHRRGWQVSVREPRRRRILGNGGRRERLQRRRGRGLRPRLAKCGIEDGQAASGVDFSLAKAGAIVGTVTARGEPLGGASIFLQTASGQAVSRLSDVFSNAGELPRARHRPGTYRLLSRAKGFGFKVIEPVVVEAGRDTNVAIALEPGVAVTLQVTDNDGNPVAGANADLFDDQNRRLRASPGSPSSPTSSLRELPARHDPPRRARTRAVQGPGFARGLRNRRDRLHDLGCLAQDPRRAARKK